MLISHIKKIRLRLLNEGIDVEVTSQPGNLDSIKIVEEKLQCQFPTELRSVYLNEFSSINLQWYTDKHLYDDKPIRGYFNLISPNQILEQLEDIQSIVDDAKKDPDLEANEGLMALVDDWAHWIPFCTFPNGDAFCLDTRYSPMPVVFLEHDVMDGGPFIHGTLIAKSFSELIDRWSKIAFIDVYDWSEIVDENGIDLNSGNLSEILSLMS